MELNVEHYNTGAASDSDDIPEEIQIEILSWLPPKLLSKFKCVSKHWNDTLTIQAFLVRHSRLYDKRPEVRFVVRSNICGKYSFVSFELNDDNTPKTTTVTVSNSYTTTTASVTRGQDVYFTDFPMTNYSYISNICNDHVCLVNPSSKCVGLLNLRTRDFISLPAITIKSVDRFWYALGFDPVHKVFKVLSIIYGKTRKECRTTKAAILTVGQSKYWNPIDNESLPRSVVKKLPSWTTNDSLCHNGVIYWVPKNAIDNVIVLTVVAFDLNREVFRDYELDTTPMRDMTFRYYLTCLKECPTLFIWKMKRDHVDEVEQWTLFNHKNPNAAWSKRNLANHHNFPIMVPYSFHGVTVAGGSTLLKSWGSSISSEWSWYSWYDLANFTI